MKTTLLTLIGISILLISCKKEVTVPNDGIYRGGFYEFSPNGDTNIFGITYLVLWESSLQFKLQGDTNSNAPASHMGTYLVDNANTMQFKYTGGYPGPYSIYHYLDTIYNYSFDDKNFKLWQTRTGGRTMEFTLVRI